MIILRSHESADWFLEHSHVPLGTTMQGCWCLPADWGALFSSAPCISPCAHLICPCSCTIEGAPHQQPWPVHLWEWEMVPKTSTSSNVRYQGGTKTQVQGLGLLCSSALGINHLKDTQSRFQQNLPTSLLTCNLHLSRISDVTFAFTLHESEGMGVLPLLLYLCYLPDPRMPYTSQIHWCSRTYAIFTNIFYKEVMAIQNAIKLFHTFVELCPHSSS
jgi:hypothetical protein